MFRVILPVIAASAMATSLVSNAHAVEVYLFKGAGDFSFVSENLHFSRGLNKISDTLISEGIHAEVRRFSAIDDALSTIRKRKPKSVAFIGHSMGALASMAMARNLRGEGIDVVYMGLIDIPGPVGVAGDNVKWVENYYSINPVYGLLTNTRSHPNAKNIHVGGYIHNRMDDAPRVQEGMLSAIRKIHLEEQNELVPQPQLVEEPLLVSVPSSGQVETVAIPQTQPTVVSQDPIALESAIRQETQAATSVQNLSTPYVLPSVQATAPTVIESQDPLLQETVRPVPSEEIAIQSVDTVTTSSVDQPSVLATGRSILRKTGDFVRGLSSRTGNRNRAVKPGREIDR